MSDANPIYIGSGADAMEAGSWYDDAYYQILLVEAIEDKDKTPGKFLRTTIVAGQRKTHEKAGEDFSQYKLDQKTIDRLSSYPKPPDFDQENISLGTYLPSPGVVFTEGFIEVLARKYLDSKTSLIDLVRSHSIEFSNFYEPIRTLLHTRKTSQLIAKTWYAYLHAKKENNGQLWNYFNDDKWDQFVGDQTDILDGLIAREIFLADHNSSSEELKPENLEIYYPLKSQYKGEHTRFLILPNSKAWQGISLSLLLAGQAYYAVDKDGKYTRKKEEIVSYHQISQPILSTGEIVMKYGVEVSWNQFKGEIIEMALSPGNNSIAYKVLIPYPPIPSEVNLSIEDIQAWADAEDDPNEENKIQIPFYHKTRKPDDTEEYLVDVRYFSPPFQYLPLSCS